jgi:hypothetical protein
MIIDVVELFGTSGRINASGIEYTREFLVKSDRIDESPFNVRNANGVPRYGSPFQMGGITEFGVCCNDISPKQNKDAPKLWNVTCQYAVGDSAEMSRKQPESNPLLEPSDWSYGTQKIEKAIYRTECIAFYDADGTEHVNPRTSPYEFPPTNTAGDQYESFPPKVIYCEVLKYSRNEGMYNNAFLAPFRGAVNADLFWGRVAGYWKCTDINAEKKTASNGATYVRVNYEFMYNPEGWDDFIPQFGWNYWNTLTSKQEPIITGLGANIKAPLDIYGQVASGGLNGLPSYKRYRNITLIPFAPLRIF